jgi:hypothetical protein
LDQAVGQGGFAVIYVGDYRKVADMIHKPEGKTRRPRAKIVAKQKKERIELRSSAIPPF